MTRLVPNLRALMDSRGIESESELARLARVEQSSLHRILKGRTRDPRDSTLAPLAQFFGVTVSDLKERDLSAPVQHHSQQASLDRDSLAGALHMVRVVSRRLELDFGEGTEEGAIVRVYEHLASGGSQDEAGLVILEYIESHRGNYYVRSVSDGADDRGGGKKGRKPGAAGDR